MKNLALCAILFINYFSQAQIRNKNISASLGQNNYYEDTNVSCLKRISRNAKNSVNIRTSKFNGLLTEITKDIQLENNKSNELLEPKIVYWGAFNKLSKSKRKTVAELAEIDAYPETIAADKFKPFNKNGIALFFKNRKIGIANDQGRVFLKPDLYTHYEEHEGFIILKNSRHNPTKLYCFNTYMSFGYELPPVIKFNPKAKHYGQVMKPRNGILVTYPDKGYDVLKYDLKRNKFIKKDEPVKLLQTVGEVGYSVYKRDNRLRIKMQGEHLIVGSGLGNGTHPLFREDNSIYGYIYTKDYSNEGKVKALYYGMYHKGTTEIKGNPNVFWLDSDGKAIKKEEIKNSYKGTSVIKKLSNGMYNIQVF